MKSCLTESVVLNLTVLCTLQFHSGNAQPWRQLLLSPLICLVTLEKHHMDMFTRLKTRFSLEGIFNIPPIQREIWWIKQKHLKALFNQNWRSKTPVCYPYTLGSKSPMKASGSFTPTPNPLKAIEKNKKSDSSKTILNQIDTLRKK